MKNIVCFIGSAQKKGTYEGVQMFSEMMKMQSEVEIEYIFLSNYNLEFCNGCKVCFNKGEEFCPLNDDRDIFIQKMEKADGVVFAVPNYAFAVSARIKNLFDRISFLLHRPRFFNKSYTVIVSQGIIGGNKIRKYLETIGKNLGFEVVKGIVIKTLEPMTNEQKSKNKKKIALLVNRFNRHLNKERPLVPGLYKLLMFRFYRSSIQFLDDEYYDYRYCRDKGWFESSYYYDVKLSFGKRAIGFIFDFIGKKIKM